MTEDMLHVMEWHNGDKDFSPFSDAEMKRRQDDAPLDGAERRRCRVVHLVSLHQLLFRLRNTLFVGVIVGVISTLLGFGAAYTDYRYKFAGKQIYMALALLPPTIPVVIMGLAMLAYLSRVNLSGNALSVIIAHVVICAPFAMAIIRLRLSQMDPSLEPAAWNLGASEWAAMRHVIIPFAAPAILGALFITMAVSFDEFAIAWFVSGLNETLPVKVLGFLQGQVSPRINAIGTFVFVASMTLVILAQVLLSGRDTRVRPTADDPLRGRVPGVVEHVHRDCAPKRPGRGFAGDAGRRAGLGRSRRGCRGCGGRKRDADGAGHEDPARGCGPGGRAQCGVRQGDRRGIRRCNGNRLSGGGRRARDQGPERP
jgi:spermidine/putrescine transport system permease protein